MKFAAFPKHTANQATLCQCSLSADKGSLRWHNRSFNTANMEGFGSHPAILQSARDLHAGHDKRVTIEACI